MKQLILAALLLSALSACGPNPAPEQGKTTSAPVDSPSATATPAPAREGYSGYPGLGNPIPFAGIFVNDTFVNEVKRTGSYVHVKMLEESCIIIPDSTLLPTAMVNGFYDSVGPWLIVRRGKGYRFTGTDTSQLGDTIIVESPQHIHISHTWFTKVNGDKQLSDWGILNGLLFAGTYTYEGKTVTLDLSGHVTGWDTIHTITTNVIPAEAEVSAKSVDKILLSKGTKPDIGTPYTYRFSGDTLHIYDYICESETEEGCASSFAGKLRYTLIKQH